jgi:uncharacterized protein VirK/YbjX
MRARTGIQGHMNRTFLYTRQILARYGVGKALQFLAYALLYPKAFAQWFDFVETVPQPQNAAEGFKLRLVMRAGFRFVNPGFSAPEAIEALMNHYTILQKSFLPAALSQFMAGYQIAEVTGQGGKKYAFKVVHEISKEGALTVLLLDTEIDAYAPLANLTGILSRNKAGQPVFVVGMLRGPGTRIPNGKQRVVDATRDLNGLRPKQAVVHAASALAQWFGVQEIVAPSTENQIAIRNWFKGQKIHADHDTFWQEFAKEPTPDGSYRLPLPLSRRNVADVQQKRRKDWHLRYQRIDAFSAEIKAVLDGLAEKEDAAARRSGSSS